MNGWERQGKRVCKAVVWGGALFGACSVLKIDPSPAVVALVLICGFVDHILDAVWPTDRPAIPSQHGKAK